MVEIELDPVLVSEEAQDGGRLKSVSYSDPFHERIVITHYPFEERAWVRD